ncbi:MAG: FAD-dependent oxidoreductase [Acidobacteriota bacterium]
MRIAVVGAGVSGLTAAYVLAGAHEVTLFEREPRLGGHAHTHDIRHNGTWPVDSGFMVFNDRTYPNFVRLLAALGIESRASDMSFSVRCRRCGLAFSSRGLGGLFADRRRLLDPGHWTLLADILRFFQAGRTALAEGAADGQSLGAFLDAHDLGEGVTRHFVLPMGGAIWSASTRDMRQFPAHAFLRFLDNHGLLAATGQPVWRTILGGSRAYVDAIAARLGAGVRKASRVAAIRRDEAGVEVTLSSGAAERFDRVVIATHADEALVMLADPSEAERRALGRFRYSVNDTWVHADAAHVPERPAARASWNAELDDCRDEGSPVTVTYDLNRLQGHRPGAPLLCSLNPTRPVAGPVFARVEYTHPILDGAAFEGQREVAALNGERSTFYCGAHLRYGFHEDGVMSALAVTERFGRGL